MEDVSRRESPVRRSVTKSPDQQVLNSSDTVQILIKLLLTDPGAFPCPHRRYMKGINPFEIPYEGSEFKCAARQKIDDDIDKLKRRIQTLRTKHNELSSTSVLLPELLSKIFILVRDLSPRPPSPDSQHQIHHAPWMRVGHICRHWREIALSDPNLWSIPVFSRPVLAQEMLQRSKMAPLIIRLNLGTPGDPRVLEQFQNALAEITRVKSIELMLERRSEIPEALFSLRSQPTPLLENISLTAPLQNGISFPPDILSGAPRLRSIHIDGLELNWESAILNHRNITSLRFANTRIITCPISQMMDALRRLPNLRTLGLKLSLPPHKESDENGGAVEFRFLERLELRATAKDCIFLLRHIRYPSSATVRLHSFSTEVEDSDTIFSLLGTNSRRPQSTEAGNHHPSPNVIRSARLTTLTWHKFAVIAFFDRVDSMRKLRPSAGLDPVIKIHFFGVNDNESFAGMEGHLLTSIGKSFDLSSLEGLLLDWSFTNDHTPAIRETLQHLPKLKIINICQSLPEICVAIAGRLHDENPENNQDIMSQYSLPLITPFPALKVIIAQGVDFQQDQSGSGIMGHLLDMLMRRSDFNAPIDTLSLEQCCSVRTSHLRQLGVLVVNLEVGGWVVDVKGLESSESGEDYGDENENRGEDSGS